ncbi:MAG: phosphoribosylformimino-5-aminoimidazole carboxamide ribotide isomerase [Akkermansiaceae bacterium]|nr:phosphoribosylformimino-5-aminoimidazole carboxamide ribotide isomerase [Akkermansiaceae bacterium]
MTKFRPCIDLHHGQVKQIVGSSLTDDGAAPRTNFIAEQPAAWYAELYKRDGLTGGHVIKLGPDNDEAALAALAAYHGGLQVGGGITADNAQQWLDAGASHVIVTSALFNASGKLQHRVLHELEERIGTRHLVLDLSCRRTNKGWTVAMNRWQTLTELEITPSTLDALSSHCAEFLIHAADVEGKCNGIDRELVELLGSWRGCPMTYAGGISTMADFEQIDELSHGSMDATVGSALDIFGGYGVRYADLVARTHRA